MRIWGHLGRLGRLRAAAGRLRGAAQGTAAVHRHRRNGAFATHVRVLASDDFEGRKPGTPGEEKTVAYLIEQFRKLGLKPGNGESYRAAGADGGDRSPPPMRRSPIAGRGATLSAGLRQGHGHLDQARSAAGGAAGTASWCSSATASSRRNMHGTTTPASTCTARRSSSWSNDPGYATKDPTVFKGGAMTYYGRWAYKVEEAARQGAAGVLLIHDADAAGLRLERGAEHLDRRAVRTGDGGRECRPCGHRRLDHKRRGAGAVQRGGTRLRGARAAAAAHAGFKAVPHGPQGRRDAAQLDPPASIPHNVIALCRAAAATMNMSVYRSLGSSGPRSGARRPQYFQRRGRQCHRESPGLLALAQSFSRTKPAADRSIVFLAFTGGGVRSARLRVLRRESGVPAAAKPRPCSIWTACTTAGRLAMSSCSAPATRTWRSPRARRRCCRAARCARAASRAGLYFRSDHFSFAQHGVPALYAQGGHRRRGARSGMGPGADRRLHGASLSPTERSVFRGLGCARRRR